MYVTAHRVSSPKGEEGINAFLHQHGLASSWPADVWRIPETNPGVLIWNNGPQVPPGGNRVRSYLDVLTPDDAAAQEIEAALTGLWLEMVAEGLGPSTAQGPLPNPIVYRHGRVVLRFGVESALLDNRALEMSELRRQVGLAMAHWFQSSHVGV